MEQKTNKKDLPAPTTLFGLVVLVGGKSRRMQQDKARLNYHGKPQYVHSFEMLGAFCEKVFVSCRQEQRIQFKKRLSVHYGCLWGYRPDGSVVISF